MKEFIDKYLNRNRTNGKRKIDDLLERTVELELRVATLECTIDEILDVVAAKPKKTKKDGGASKPKRGRKPQKEVVERKNESTIDNIIKKKEAEGQTLIEKRKKRSGVWVASFTR